MITVIQNGNYDEETFNSALTLPICLFLRDRSIQIALADKFQLSDIQRTNLKIKTQNLKEIWKYRVSEKVVEAVGKRVLAAPEPSPLLVEITFSYKDDNNELRSLYVSNTLDEFSIDRSKRNYALKSHRKFFPLRFLRIFIYFSRYDDWDHIFRFLEYRLSYCNNYN